MRQNLNKMSISMLTALEALCLVKATSTIQNYLTTYKITRYQQQ